MSNSTATISAEWTPLERERVIWFIDLRLALEERKHTPDRDIISNLSMLQCREWMIRNKEPEWMETNRATLLLYLPLT